MKSGLTMMVTSTIALLLNLGGCREDTTEETSRSWGSARVESVSPEMALVSNECQGSHDILDAYLESGSHLIVKDASQEHVKAFHSALSAVPEAIQKLLYLSGVRVEINGSKDIHSICVDGLYGAERTLVGKRGSKVKSCLYEDNQDSGLILLMEADKEFITASTVRSVGIIISQYISEIAPTEDGAVSVGENEMFRAVLRSLLASFLNDVDKSKTFDIKGYKELIDENLVVKTKPRTVCDVPKDTHHEVFANYVFGDFLHNQYCGSSGRSAEKDFKESREFFQKDAMAALSILTGEKEVAEYSYASCEGEQEALSLRRANLFAGGGILGWLQSWRDRRQSLPSIMQVKNSPRNLAKRSNQPRIIQTNSSSSRTFRAISTSSSSGGSWDTFEASTTRSQPRSEASQSRSAVSQSQSAVSQSPAQTKSASISREKSSKNVRKGQGQSTTTGALSSPMSFEEFVSMYDGK